MIPVENIRKAVGSVMVVLGLGATAVTGLHSVEMTKEQEQKQVAAEQPKYEFEVRGTSNVYLGEGQVSNKILLNNVTKVMKESGIEVVYKPEKLEENNDLELNAK